LALAAESEPVRHSGCAAAISLHPGKEGIFYENDFRGLILGDIVVIPVNSPREDENDVWLFCPGNLR
jgi:hypothetical protein